MTSNIVVVVGGQYGSEAKGAVAACLSRQFDAHDVVIRVAGPNAGHTAYDSKGREWKLRSVPVGAVSNKKCQLHLAAGSQIDLEVLIHELHELDTAGHEASARLTIHPMATILTPGDIAAETASGIVGRIGSTGKGIGAARAARIGRTAQVARDIEMLAPFLIDDGPFELDEIDRVVIEGTQGYGLGLHHRNYPQVTSSDCRAIDFLAMAGISPWSLDVGELNVVVVARCFPIRVAGNSGPMKDETSWAGLGLPEERTTVTNKVRRVGEWDRRLVREAILANGGGQWNPQVKLAITMLDQKFPELAGCPDSYSLFKHGLATKMLSDIQDDMTTEIRLVGTGPQSMFGLELY